MAKAFGMTWLPVPLSLTKRWHGFFGFHDLFRIQIWVQVGAESTQFELGDRICRI